MIPGTTDAAFNPQKCLDCVLKDLELTTGKVAAYAVLFFGSFFLLGSNFLSAFIGMLLVGICHTISSSGPAETQQPPPGTESRNNTRTRTNSFFRKILSSGARYPQQPQQPITYQQPPTQVLYPQQHPIGYPYGSYQPISAGPSPRRSPMPSIQEELRNPYESHRHRRTSSVPIPPISEASRHYRTPSGQSTPGSAAVRPKKPHRERIPRYHSSQSETHAQRGVRAMPDSNRVGSSQRDSSQKERKIHAMPDQNRR